MKQYRRPLLQRWLSSHDDPPQVQAVKRRAYLAALLVSLPGLLLIVPYLWTRGLYANLALHLAVVVLTLVGVLLVTRWPRFMPLAERLMGLALTASGVAYALSRLVLGAGVYTSAFAPLVLLFISAGLLVAMPVRAAPLVIGGLLCLNVLGDWWPQAPARVIPTLMLEFMEAGTLALMVTLLLYRHLWGDARRRGRDLERLAHTDELTGLPNRRAVIQAYRRAPGAVLLFDLDDFKRINDRYGHPEGDRVLWHVARVLREALGGLGTLGRWGGEEFLAVLPGHDLPGALAVAEALRRAVGASGGGAEPLSVSVGVAAPTPGEDLGALLRRADRAIYTAKDAGKNTVRAAEEPQPA